MTTTVYVLTTCFDPSPNFDTVEDVLSSPLSVHATIGAAKEAALKESVVQWQEFVDDLDEDELRPDAPTPDWNTDMKHSLQPDSWTWYDDVNDVSYRITALPLE